MTGLQSRRPGVFIEVVEVFNMAGDVRPRLIAHYDGRQRTETAG